MVTIMKASHCTSGDWSLIPDVLAVVQLRPGFWSTLWLALVGLAATLGGSGLALVFAALWLYSLSSGGSRPSRPDAEPPGTPTLSTESSADGMSGAALQAMREQLIGPWQLETGQLHRLHVAVCLMLTSDEPACCCSCALHCTARASHRTCGTLCRRRAVARLG